MNDQFDHGRLINRQRIIPPNNGRVSDEYWIRAQLAEEDIWMHAEQAQPLRIPGAYDLDLFTNYQAGEYHATEGMTGLMLPYVSKTREGVVGQVAARLFWRPNYKKTISKGIEQTIPITGLSPRYGGGIK